MRARNKLLQPADILPFTPTVQEKPRYKLAQESQLRRMNGRHKDAMRLIAQGTHPDTVAEIVGLSRRRIDQLMSDPMAKEFLDHEIQLHEARLRALTGASVSAIANGLTDRDPDVQLKAARLQLETQGRLKGNANQQQTAEDVVAQIIQIAQLNVNVQR